MLKVAAVPSNAKASSRGTGSSGRRMASINPRPKFKALKPYWTSTRAVDIDIVDIDMSADVIRSTAVPSAPPCMATGSRTCRTDGRIAEIVGSTERQPDQQARGVQREQRPERGTRPACGCHSYRPLRRGRTRELPRIRGSRGDSANTL